MSPFSIIIGIGASFGLLRVMQRVPSSAHFRWLTAGLLMLFGAMLGARAGFVLAYFSYYKIHPAEIPQLAKGGLFWPGALAGAILFALLALWLFRLPIRSGLDQLSRMLLPLALFIWLAAWQAGIAYGKPLPANTWWGASITDDSGMTTLRAPVQPAAVISLIFLLGICEWLLRRSQKPGLKAGVLSSAFAMHTLLFSFLRFDAMQRFFGLRLDSWAAMLFMFGSVLFLLNAIFHKQRIITPEDIEMEK